MVNSPSNFRKLKAEIVEILSKAEFELERAHAIDTLKWVKKIDSNASEWLQIAALAHDIDRAIPPKVSREKGESYDEYKIRHSRRSAQLIAELMAKYGYANEEIAKTSHIVENHEVGGDEESDILKDADSISFFSCNIEWYYKYKNKDLAETKREILYKFERATPRAKDMIRTIKIKNEVLREVCEEILVR